MSLNKKARRLRLRDINSNKTNMDKIHLFAEAYLPKLSTFFDLMAGFLTCSPLEVFPSKTTVTF